MKWFFVVCEVRERWDKYEKLYQELSALDAQRIQSCVWFLKTDYKVTAEEISDTLKVHIGKDDRLLVIESVDSSWQNLITNPLVA